MTKHRRKRVEVVETETHIVVLFGIAGGVMVLVQVPGGAVEGGICAFVMPSGATVQIVVPPGSGPGTILEVADPGAMLPTAEQRSSYCTAPTRMLLMVRHERALTPSETAVQGGVMLPVA